MAEQRTQEAWGIVSDAGLLPFTIRQTREQAINDFCHNNGYDIPAGVSDVWRWLKGRGNRCVRVTLSFEA